MRSFAFLLASTLLSSNKAVKKVIWRNRRILTRARRELVGRFLQWSISVCMPYISYKLREAPPTFSDVSLAQQLPAVHICFQQRRSFTKFKASKQSVVQYTEQSAFNQLCVGAITLPWRQRTSRDREISMTKSDRLL